MDDVWLYYYRHHTPYAESFETLKEAMLRAEYLEDDLQGSVEAVVDVDGTEYDEDAWRAWLAAYRKEHPSPAPASYGEEPTEYREFRGEKWLV